MECSLERSAEKMMNYIDWIYSRKVKLSHLRVRCPLTECYHLKLVEILNRSAFSLMSVELNEDANPYCAVYCAALSQCKNLSSVELWYWTLSQPFWDMLAETCSLDGVELVSCSLPKDTNTSVTCPSVRWLTLDQCSGDELDAALLSVCTRIISFGQHSGDALISSMLPPTLLNLTISTCDVFIVDGLPAGLLDITITGTSLTEGDVEGIFKSCPNLENIDFYDNESDCLSEAHIVSIGKKYAKTLKSFNVSQMRGLTEAALKFVCEQCTVLETLNISNNDYLPESVYATVLDSSLSLRKLQANNTKISDEALCRIARAPLTLFDMRHCTGYTERGLTALLDGCDNLKVLRLGGHLINPFVRVLWSRQRPGLLVTGSG